MGRTEWNAHFVTKDKQRRIRITERRNKKEKKEKKAEKCYKCVYGKRWKRTKYDMIYQLDAIEYLFAFFQLDMFRAYTPIFRSNGC